MKGSSYSADLKLLMEDSRGYLFVALLLTIFSAALDLLCISVLPGFVSWALAPGSTGFFASPWVFQALGLGESSQLSTAMVVIALFLLRAIVTILVGGYLSQLAQIIRRRNARRIVSGCLKSPYVMTLRHSVADGITAATAHTAHFANAVMLPLLRLVVDLMTIAALLGFLAWFSPRLTAGLALVLAVVALSYVLLVRGSSRKHSQRVVKLDAEFSNKVSQALQGAREVRIYQAHDYFMSEIARTLGGLEHSQARLGAIYWMPRAVGELVLILVAVAYMIFTVRNGLSETIVLSNLSAFALAGMRLLPAFAQCMVGVAMVRAGQAVTSALADEIRRTSVAPDDSPANTGKVPAPAFESLELSDIRFAYDGAPPVLDGVNLKIVRGQSVGLIGRSGAGKSTLGDLILGLLAPQQGSIRINSVECRLDEPGWWQRVGFVPQNPFIANDTLARNVAYGLPDEEIDFAQLTHALQLAQLAPLVQQWPDGVHTELGESGVRLSGGQRQRVAIARALYRNRELLVLDEATSALDGETEKEIIQALTALHGKITILAIAHRQSTLDACDFIIELSAGQFAKTPQIPGLSSKGI